MEHVEGVVGRKVALPCDIEPPTKDDNVHMVLWFEAVDGEPLYSSVILTNIILAQIDLALTLKIFIASH
ncbi:Nectin-2 [Frankliniella fusca]|uniref:Nectin-2 n=1 Tax=Frankliniella fusca TaxID=407009 RepID=A0AAE1HL83_9NEOP|nr:Nectin-2 [Frankliniella fusca]